MAACYSVDRKEIDSILERKVGNMRMAEVIHVIKDSFGLQMNFLAVLLCFMLVDCLIGLMVVVSKKKFSKGILENLIKKFTILILIILAALVDLFLMPKGNMITSGVILYYLSYEGNEILKNVRKIGLPYPKALKNILEWLREGV